MKKECGIINLDSKIGVGTHWVCYRNIDKYCEYFDSFGLIMPNEVQTYLSSSGKQIIYSGHEIQERDSVLCGYWCIYYLNERQKGKTILETIHNPMFNMFYMVKSYCIKQKKVTECAPGSERYVRTKHGRIMLKCTCAECGITKTKFIKQKQGN